MRDRSSPGRSGRPDAAETRFAEGLEPKTAPYGVVTSLSALTVVYDQIHTQVIGNAATAIEGLLHI